mmetsp:Transcript_13965/g.39187  ORF Transcript_13965/g.39187 Transcript_13965/m.39187 type:complete len:234 (-) Transcript_13965:735-1436(-)
MNPSKRLFLFFSHVLLYNRLADLALDTDVVHHVVFRISQGCHKELIPKRSAVCLVIQKTDTGIDSFRNSLPNNVDRRLVRPGTLEEPTVSSQNLVQLVSGKIQKSLGNVNDRIVGKRGIGNGEILLGSRKSRHEPKIGFHKGLDGTKPRGHGQRSVFVFVPANLVDDLLGPGSRNLGPNCLFELVQLLLQTVDLFLEGFQQKLLSKAAALGMFAVSFTALELLFGGELSSGSG